MAEKHLTDIELLEFLLKDLPDYEKEYIFNKYLNFTSKHDKIELLEFFIIEGDYDYKEYMMTVGKYFSANDTVTLLCSALLS